MSYVARTSGALERVLYRTTYHWLYWAGGAALALAPLAVLAALPLGSWLVPVTAAGAAIAVPFGLYILIKALATEISVTSDRFVKKSGLVSFQSEDMSLDKIEEIELDQSIVGAILGYGTLAVRGTGTGSILVEMVQSPERLEREIGAARGAMRFRRAA